MSEHHMDVIAGHRSHAFVCGDCEEVIRQLPKESVHCVITSPPYWKLREYDAPAPGMVGEESEHHQYVTRLKGIFREIHRVLHPTGSVWLNLGDKYHNKNLLGLPWRVAIAMQDDGWILRNDIVWDQMKGTQSPRDRFRDSYEHLFFFVKSQRYWFDADAVRIKPRHDPKVTDTSTVSATGVSGIKYRRQIAETTALSDEEKAAATLALDSTLARIRAGEIVDFRMTIRGVQRTYHGDTLKLSGRAKELNDKGFYVMTSSAKGFLPADIWRIVPEDTWRKDAHYAVFPEALLEVPINATCPPNGVVLDPFSGTGSAVAAAVRLGRRGIGIDLSEKYTSLAETRVKGITHTSP